MAWRPRDIGQWLLTLVAAGAAVVTSGIAVSVFHPVGIRVVPGGIPRLALFFPLHLLPVSLAAGALHRLSARSGARPAAAGFGLVAVVTAWLALWPSLAMWRLARQEHVSLSIGSYLASAASLELGGPRLERSVEYGTAADGSRLLLDVWAPESTHAGMLAAAVVRLHGGGWTAGARSQIPSWDEWLNGLGYFVFDVEYRLSPPERWKDEVGDVKCALGWVAANAARYRIDPARISLMGSSAGGNLAMLAAYTTGDPELPPSCEVPPVAVRSVVNLYGPADLVLFYDSSDSLAWVRSILETYIGGPPARFPERYRAVSPIRHVGAGTPPTLTLLGESDRIVPRDQALALDRALAAAGIAHETYLLPVTYHLFDMNWGGFATQFARAKIEAFLMR